MIVVVSTHRSISEVSVKIYDEDDRRVYEFQLLYPLGTEPDERRMDEEYLEHAEVVAGFIRELLIRPENQKRLRERLLMTGR